MINGFNSRRLHVMTGEHYRETATTPAYVLVLAVHRQRLRYLGHVLSLPADRMVRCALMALVSDSVMYPTGSLFCNCQSVALPQLVSIASNRAKWRRCCEPAVFSDFLVMLMYHRTAGVYNEQMYVLFVFAG